LLLFFRNLWFRSAVPLPQEGRFAIVTDVGSGMRWTRWCRETNDAYADGEGVWFWRPKAGVKLATMLTHRADDGDNNVWLTGKSAQ